MKKPRKSNRIQASQDRRFAMLIARIAEERLKRTGSEQPIRRVGATSTLIRRATPGEGVSGGQAVVAGLRFDGIQKNVITGFDGQGTPNAMSRLDRIELHVGTPVQSETFGARQFDANNEYVWFKARSGTEEEEQP